VWAFVVSRVEPREEAPKGERLLYAHFCAFLRSRLTTDNKGQQLGLDARAPNANAMRAAVQLCAQEAQPVACSKGSPFLAAPKGCQRLLVRLPGRLPMPVAHRACPCSSWAASSACRGRS